MITDLMITWVFLTVVLSLVFICVLALFAIYGRLTRKTPDLSTFYWPDTARGVDMAFLRRHAWLFGDGREIKHVVYSPGE